MDAPMPLLTSVAVPCTTRDIPGFERLLSCWSDERFFPIRPREDFAPLLLIVIVNQLDETIASKFLDIYARHKKLHSIFNDCVVFDAGLEGDRDLYVRGEKVAKGQYGNKAGPNFLFFETMQLINQFGGFTFQCEVDCYPLSRGWLHDLTAIIERRSFAWVIGSIYTGHRPVGRDIQLHFNGNAIYQSGSAEFVQFVKDLWQPRMLEYVDLDPNLAYDCWWALETSRASSLVHNRSWQLVTTYSQFFCNNQFLINVVDKETAAEDAERALNDEAASGQKCLFLHGHGGTHLVEEFMASRETNFPRFLVERARRLREALAAPTETYEKILASTASDAAEEIEVWTSMGQAANVEAALPSVNLPISIQDLPAVIFPDKIEPASYLGNWHRQNISDHVWSSSGIAALSFQFPPQKRLRILLRGRRGPGVAEKDVQFRAFGPSKASFAATDDSTISFHLEDQKPFSHAVVMIETKKAGRVEGDVRDLGFVLFSIEIDSTA